VHAAEALAHALKIPMSELGVIYWAPITLSSQYEGVMVTVTKRVHDPAHYSSLGPFKWSSLDVIEPVIYENYTLQALPAKQLKLPRSAEAYTLTIDAPTPRGATSAGPSIMFSNDDIKEGMDVGDDDDAILGGSWVRDMMAFNAACTTPLEPGLYLGIHYVKISGPRVEVMLSKQLLHLLPAVRITADYTAPSKAEWAWISSLSQPTTTSSTNGATSDTTSNAATSPPSNATPPWQWALSDSRRLSELDLAYGASVFSLGASASNQSSSALSSTMMGAMSSTSPAGLGLTSHNTFPQSSSSPPLATASMTGNNGVLGSPSMISSSAPWMSSSLFASLTSAIDRRLTSARTRDSLGNKTTDPARHSSLTKASPPVATLIGAVSGAAAVGGGSSTLSATIAGIGGSAGGGTRTPRTRSPNGTPMLSPVPEPHGLTPPLPPAEAALQRFQRAFLTAASDLAVLLGSDADLVPQNIYKQVVVTSIRGDVKMILLVVCKMQGSFPKGYSRDRLTFRPVNVFEAIHKNMHAFKRLRPKPRKVNNALHSFHSNTNVPHLLAATSTFPGINLHSSRPSSRPPTAQGMNGRPLTATSIGGTTQLANGFSTTIGSNGATSSGTGGNTYRAISSIPVPASSVGATRSTTPTHLFLRSGTVEPGNGNTPSPLTPSILTPTAISPLLPSSLTGTSGAMTSTHYGHGSLMNSGATPANGVFPPKRRTLPAKEGAGDAGLATLAQRRLDADHKNGIAHHHSFPSPPHAAAVGHSTLPLFTKTSPRMMTTRVNGEGEPTLTLEVGGELRSERPSPAHSPLIVNHHPGLTIATFGSPFPSPHKGDNGHTPLLSSHNGMTSSSTTTTTATTTAASTVTTTPASGRSDRGSPIGSTTTSATTVTNNSSSSSSTATTTASTAMTTCGSVVVRSSPDSKRARLMEKVIRAPRDSDDDNAVATNGGLVVGDESHIIRDREAKTELVATNDDDDVAHPPTHATATEVENATHHNVVDDDDDDDGQHQQLIHRKGTVVVDADDDDSSEDEDDEGGDGMGDDRDHDLSAREAEEAYEKHNWLREIMETHLVAPDEKRREHLMLRRLKQGIMDAGQELIRDRRYHLVLYHDVLIGSQLVDWMIKNGHAYDRATAVLHGERLSAEFGLRHYLDALPFKDAPTFYTFKPRDKPLVEEVRDTATVEQAAALARMSHNGDDIGLQSIRMTSGRMSEHDVKVPASTAALLEAVNNIMVDSGDTIANGSGNNGLGGGNNGDNGLTVAATGGHRRIRSNARASMSSQHSKKLSISRNNKSNLLDGNAIITGSLDGSSNGPISPTGASSPPGVARLSSRPGGPLTLPPQLQQKVQSFAELKAVLMASPLILDRRVYLRDHPSCLIGSQLIDWLLVNGNAPERASAVIIAQELFDRHGLRHQPNNPSDTTFKDGPGFYTFLPIDGPTESRPPLLTRALSRLPGLASMRAAPATPHRTVASISTTAGNITTPMATPQTPQGRKISSHSPHASHGGISAVTMNAATLTPPRVDRAISSAMTNGLAPTSPPRSPNAAAAIAASAAVAAAAASSPHQSSSPFSFGRTLSTKPGMSPLPPSALTSHQSTTNNKSGGGNGTTGGASATTPTNHSRTISKPPIIDRTITIGKPPPTVDRFRSMSKPVAVNGASSSSSSSVTVAATSAATASSSTLAHPGLPDRRSSTEADLTSSVVATSHHTRTSSRIPQFARLISHTGYPPPVQLITSATSTAGNGNSSNGSGSLTSTPRPLGETKGFPSRPSMERASATPPLIRPYFPTTGDEPLTDRDHDSKEIAPTVAISTVPAGTAPSAIGVLPTLSSFDHVDFTINTSMATPPIGPSSLGLPSLSTAPPLHLSVAQSAPVILTMPPSPMSSHPHSPQPSSPERKKMKPGRDTDGTGRAVPKESKDNKEKAKQTLMKHVKGKASVVQSVTAADIAGDIVSSSGLIGDRWRGLSSHKQCLIGSELVTWLMSRGYAWDR
jgi:hypothetical protein